MMTPTTRPQIGSWSQLKHPELIVPEAFEGHPQRIQPQIATATDTSLQEVVAAFLVVCQEPGVITIGTLEDYAAARDSSIYIYQGHRLISAAQRDNHSKKARVVNILG